MATNIEQIFRSFVVSKFREIQEQQFGSEKVGQQNGEINSSEEVNSADVTIGALQNDPLVQKIEQVLSEVLGAEPQYKPDAGQDTVKNKSRSTKRGIPDEVQDEIPRKKSKKDKKHKDKKKKKKRKKEKKEKKYKKQSKESKLNSDHKGFGDIQPASHLNPKSLVLSGENLDVGPTSPLKHDSQWFMEKTVYENLNSSLSNSHDASNSDTSKLDASEDDSVLISMQELCEGELTNERELENYTCQHTNLAVNLHVEDELLNTADGEGDDTIMKKMEQPEASSALQVAEYIDVSENSPKFMAVELEDLEARVESYSEKAKELDSLSESLDPEIMAQSETVSSEKTGCKLMKTPLETNVEAKDSVTTLGFLAMVVGKDFEATSEFLNKAKVKASERCPKDGALTVMKDELEQESEKIAMMEDLEKTLWTQSRMEKKDLEEIPESTCTVSGKDLESYIAPKPKVWPEDSEGSKEPDECKCMEASLDPETIGVRKLKETQTSALVMELNDQSKYQKSLGSIADVEDFERAPELEIIKRTDSEAYFLDTDAKHLEAAAESEEMNVGYLRGTSVFELAKEEWSSIPEPVVDMKNLESVEASPVNYLEAPFETTVEKRKDMDVPKDSETVVKVKVSESISRSEKVPESNNLGMAPETLDNSAKTQYLVVSKHLALTDIENETDVNLMDLNKNPEQPLVTSKKIETISETLYVTEMKHLKDVLQLDAMAQGKNSEINLKPEEQEEERDAASESLHMIFTNYSEHSLELYTEPEPMTELKSSERVPGLLHREDANISEALPPREAEDLKTIKSAAVVKLNDLEKKLEYLPREMKNREVDSKTVTNVKYLETLVPSEAVTKRKDMKIVPYSVTGVKEKALGTTEHVESGQKGAETAEQEAKSVYLKVKDIAEKRPSAEIKGPLFIDPKDASKLLNTAADFESISSHHAVQNLESLQFLKTKAREINLSSQHALEVKCTARGPELLFSDELTQLQEEQKLEESTETIGFTATSDSPYASGTDLIVASESSEVNEDIDSDHCTKSLSIAQTNSDSFLKSSHMIDSKLISESKIMDTKNLEVELESSHKAGIETEDLPKYESAASQFFESIEESLKKNEMQESNMALGNKVLTVPGLEANSETVCVLDTENLEVIKKTHVAPSQLTLGVIGIEGTPVLFSSAEDKDLKTAVESKHLVASMVPADVVKETFDFALVTDKKNSEATQMLEANLESLAKKGVNTKFDYEVAPNGSEVFKKYQPTIGVGTTEGMLPIINKAEEKESGTNLKPEATLVEKYSKSVCESVHVSETEDCDTTLSKLDVKDSELNSDFVDAGEVKATTLQFGTTSEAICVLQLGDSDNVMESLLTSGVKDLRETLNCEIVLEAEDPVPLATNQNTSELKSSESVCMLEITNSEGILELTTPTYLSSAHLESSNTTTEMETLNIIDSEAPLKSETEVRYFESISETDCVQEPFGYKAVAGSEYISEKKVPEKTSEAIFLKQVGDLETKAESKHTQERRDSEPLVQSVYAVQVRYVEESLVYQEVQDVSENTPQFPGTMETEDLGATTSVVAEMGKNSDKIQLHFRGKCSETAIECTDMPDLTETCANVELVCRIERKHSEPTAEMTHVGDIKNLEPNLGFMGMTELKGTTFEKSKTGPEFMHLKDIEAIAGKSKDVQIVQCSSDKEEGMYFEGGSESLLVLERQDSERDSTSMLVSEVVSEESLKSIPVVKAEDSEAARKYMNAKGIEVSEQNSECVCMGEMKELTSVPEHAELAQAENFEMSSEVTLEVKNLEATLDPLCLIKEKTSAATTLVSLEEQIVKACLKSVCGAEENNLAASQQITVEVKDSEAALEPVKIVGKALEATSCTSLKDQHSEVVQESSEIMKENDESISKDRKSEKISSKSKDKSKSGKKAKKSRSKSPSKSKKRKKKSRSCSTSRQTSSRRARSRSKNDSDSRKKHSSSRRKSRSKSAERKEGKESSLRSRRRRSRTSDHHKSRSKSVDKREGSLWSRRRQSRSPDRRKSRSKSVDRRESVQTRRRMSRSSDNHKSRSKSADKRETFRSRRRRSRSSDHHKSRSRSTDKREMSTRTRRRRSRSSDNHKSRSRSVDKRESPVRRRRRRSRSSDNYKSRSKSVDRRDSSVRSRRRRSRSSDHHKSRSKSVDDKREISVRTRRRRSRSSENRRSRSKSVDKRESLRTRRRLSRSSDNRKSRSRSGNRETLRTRRRRSRSSDNRKSRSKSVDKRESSVRARRRQSRSSDHKSRSKSVDKRETSVRAKRRRSGSSNNCKSRSKSVDTRETSARAKSRRSRSSDNRKSRSKSVEKREASARAKRRSRSSDNRKSRSKSVDKRETSVRTRRRSRSSDNRKSRSKSFDKRETSAKRKRSRSSENSKSRSKSVDKIEVSSRSKRRRSKSSDRKSTKSGEKRDSSVKTRNRKSKSSDRQKSKSKSRSKSSERRKDKDSSNASKEKCSKSRSKSKSPEKPVGNESLEASVHNRTKSPEYPKSRSRSKSLDKTEDRDRLRRSRSKCSEPKSQSHRTVSRSRRNCSRSLTRKRNSRSKSDHRSRSRSRTRSRSCSKRWRRTRSRSVSRQRSLSRERRRRSRRNRSRSVDRRRRRSDSRDSYRVALRLRSRSRTPVRLGTSRSTGRRRSSSVSPDHRRSRSSSRSPKRLTDLDKAQLLEIAKANAAAMCAKAGVPLPPSLMPVVTPEKKEEKVTQKSAKETIMELTEKCKKIAQSQEDDVIVNKPHVSDEEEEEHPFINHPFKLNEPKPIFFNLTTPTIKPAPPKNQVTLTKEFPVSSGSQHRKKEADSAYGEWVPVEKNKEENKDDVFPNPSTLEPVDISSALNERTLAQKRLTENTFDLEAMCLLNRAQERIDAWAQLNSLPGQFTGSTGAQVLSSEQLSNSGPQAWIKKDQFLRAAPVTGGMGAQLMRKMGWREGEGLGKNKEGSREPILVDFKTDRKGLVAFGEKTQKRHGVFSAVKDLAGKHPISLLMEACNKRRWSPPTFVLVTDNGPDHRKCFLFKVMVNGVEHKPTFASPNKKLAKATAATVALQALGIVPKELLANATSFRSASHN